MAIARFCKHGNLRLTCKTCKEGAVEEATMRAAVNRSRGESNTMRAITGTQLPYEWQRGAFDAWHEGGRVGLVALSVGLPMGDLPFEVMAALVNEAPTTNVLLAAAPNETDKLRAELQSRFGINASSLADHHFLEPKSDGVCLVADLEELQTVDLAGWGRFNTNGVMILLDADGVGPQLGQTLLSAPFRYRFCLTRKPSAIDLLVSRPWVQAFGPLLYRYTEDQARDVGILPKIRYRLHVEMLRPEAKQGQGAQGPWEATDIPTRLPGFRVGNFVRGKARDVATERASQQEKIVVLHDGIPVKGAHSTIKPSQLPEAHDDKPSAWLIAHPNADAGVVLRVATTAWKTLQEPGQVEDAVVLPVPADLCRVPPWDDRWRSAAAQIDRAIAGLLLAENPGEAMTVEDLEALVGVALALRGLPAEELYKLTPVVTEAAEAAHSNQDLSPERVAAIGKSYGGLGAALALGSAGGSLFLLRVAHPRITPVTPDLPHPSLCDAGYHAWRGRAFAALASAANRADMVTAWGRYPELRFVFPSSTLLEAATEYCRAHKVKGPLQDAKIAAVADVSVVDQVDPTAAIAALQLWRDALAKAEEHERDFLADMHARQPERERRREGMALPELAVVDKRSDSITLESKRGRFPSTNISPGSEVALVEQGKRDELGRGLVNRITARRITVEFPAGAPRQLPDNVTVNLIFDAKVFEAYHSAILGSLRAVTASNPDDDGPDGLIRSAMLGEKMTKSKPQSLGLDDVTESQGQTIDNVLSGGRVHLVHGPPGTGKTHTLVRMATALTRARHSVLVTADSNAAVDNLVVGLRRQGALVVRIGHAPNLRDPAAEPARIDPIDAPQFVRWAAEQGIVVATTNYGAFRYLDAKGSLGTFLFDYVIHDEAGQATAPSSLAAAMRGRRLVLAGDPKQLPPTVVSMDAKDAGLDVTLFERIEELTGRERTTMLSTQFRMRKEILKFSNENFYEGQIETAEVAETQEILSEIPPAAFQHVTGRENDRQRNGSISNDFEVAAVVHLLKKFQAEARDRGWSIAVLTPYQAQREQLRRALPDLEISTVDGAQGREWDIVFYSSVRSNPRHRLGFVSDERRLNVAVTRARKHFILVGDERTLRGNKMIASLVDSLEKIRMFYPDRDTPEGLRPGRGHTGAKQNRRKRGPRDGKPPRRDQDGKDNSRRAGRDGDNREKTKRSNDDGERRRKTRQDKPAGDSEEPLGRKGGKGAAGKPARPKAATAPVETNDVGVAEKPKRAKKTSKKVAKPAEPESPKPAKKVEQTTLRAVKKPKGPAMCAAKTKAGSPCKFKAKEGSKFCGRHQ